MAFLGIWGAWLAFSISIGRWLGRKFGKRWVPWMISPIIFLLPQADVFLASWVGKRLVEQIGTYRVNEIVQVAGFLDLSQTDTNSLSFLHFYGEHTYQYLEVQYTRPVSLQWTSRWALGPGPWTFSSGSWILGPGYYQFWRLDPTSALCEPIGSEVSTDIWRRGADNCMRITHSKTPVSKFSVSGWTSLNVGGWAERLGILTNCRFVREISSDRVLAQDCSYYYASILGWITFDWRYPPEGSRKNNALRVSAVLVPEIA